MASEKHVNYFTNQARGAVVHFRVATNSVPAELIITYNAVIGFGNEPDVEWRITKWPVYKKSFPTDVAALVRALLAAGADATKRGLRRQDSPRNRLRSRPH